MKPLIAAALGKRPERYPIWFMRQAGRYLPEYRQVRAGVSFTELCKTPKLAAEVTLQPLRRYDLDAAIIFSDILIPAMAMGQDLSFDHGEGPQLSHPVRSAKDLLSLSHPKAERDLGYVGEAIAETKAHLRADQAMIGFAGAPFTVASYMIEGGSSKNFTEVKRLLFTDRPTFQGLIDKITEVTLDYLQMQIRAGADIVMLFDTWAGQLTSFDYRDTIWPATRKLLAQVHESGTPVIYFPGQGSDRLYDLESAKLDVISVDWRTPLERAANVVKDLGLNVCLQGNLDPQLLIAPEATIRTRTRMILDAAKKHARSHIFNVGHGLLPHTPPQALSWVIDEVRKA